MEARQSTLTASHAKIRIVLLGFDTVAHVSFTVPFDYMFPVRRLGVYRNHLVRALLGCLARECICAHVQATHRVENTNHFVLCVHYSLGVEVGGPRINGCQAGSGT
jgi:hypothetical protein